MSDSEISISRRNKLINQVVFVNGFPGCGKTMLSPIIATFERVEIMQYPSLIEQICELNSIDALDKDVAESMIKMNADLLLYNVMMGRQTNCRPRDLSSIFRHKPITHIKRMLAQGDEKIPDIINLKNPILHLTSHMQLGSSKLLFSALKDNLSFFEVVRHPLYMLMQMEKNFDMLSGPRSQHITFEYNKKEYPFFARGWEKKFDEANTFEKAIYSLDAYYSILFSENYHDSVKIIPFEIFVKSPELFITMISKKLNSAFNKNVRKEMLNQKVPRKLLSDGPALDIYKRCGWVPPQTSNESSELDIRRKYISNNVSKDALSCLDKISALYEERFLPGFL